MSISTLSSDRFWLPRDLKSSDVRRKYVIWFTYDVPIWSSDLPYSYSLYCTDNQCRKRSESGIDGNFTTCKIGLRNRYTELMNSPTLRRLAFGTKLTYFPCQYLDIDLDFRQILTDLRSRILRRSSYYLAATVWLLATTLIQWGSWAFPSLFNRIPSKAQLLRNGDLTRCYSGTYFVMVFAKRTSLLVAVVNRSCPLHPHFDLAATTLDFAIEILEPSKFGVYYWYLGYNVSTENSQNMWWLSSERVAFTNYLV